MAPVIRGKEDDSVIKQVETLESIEKSAECFVQPFYHTVVAPQVLMCRTTECGEIGRYPFPSVSFPISIRRWIIVQMILVVRFNV